MTDDELKEFDEKLEEGFAKGVMTENEIKVNKMLEKCSELVLCKEELFFQTEDGKTLSSWFPVCKASASICSLYFGISLSYEGGEKIKSKEVIINSFID